MEEAQDSFQEFFRTQYRALWRFFRALGFSEEDAEDLTQETFFRVYKGWASFMGKAKRLTWTRQIAWNVYKNHLREGSAQKRSARLISLEAHQAGIEAMMPKQGKPLPQPVRELLLRECKERLRKAIAQLPPQMQRCILLRDRQGLKYREIAEVLQTSIETVKSHLHQARHRLRQKVGDCYDDL